MQKNYKVRSQSLQLQRMGIIEKGSLLIIIILIVILNSLGLDWLSLSDLLPMERKLLLAAENRKMLMLQ